MRRILFLAALYLVFSHVCLSQDENIVIEAFDDGEYFFAREEYAEAAYYYRQVVARFPDHANFNFKLGSCFLNIPGSETLAIPHFEKAVQALVEKKKYRGKDYEETNAPLHALFYLGNAYRMNNELNKALDVYYSFLNSPHFRGNYNLAIVENEISSCERAKIIQDNPVNFIEHEAGAPINSPESELKPVVSSDEQYIAFVRRLRFYDAVFFSVKEVNEWSDPININPFIGSDGDFYPACFSSDKKALYLIREDEANSDIYVSHFSDNQWSKAEKLGRSINSKRQETSAWISEDGQTLYFVSSRRRGRGGKDIYFSELKANGEWGRAQNAGKTINTRFDEESPCLAGHDQILYFSSKGHYNMGGFDIFYARGNENSWTEPVNIGYPVNDTGDNTGFVPVAGEGTGYYSRINLANGSSEDIFRVQVFDSLHVIRESDRE